jgi:hypothetical protein
LKSGIASSCLAIAGSCVPVRPTVKLRLSFVVASGLMQS